MTLRASFALSASLLTLAACGDGSGGGAIGTGTGTNGLRFAVAGDVYQDVQGAGPIKVKVVRALTDWDAGTTQLLMSDETLTVTSISDFDSTVTITLGGETVILVDGTADAPANDSTWSATFLDTGGTYSAIGKVYTSAGGEDPALTGEFDTDAYFVYGFETDPAQIASLTGQALYSGNVSGYGQLLDLSGASIDESGVSFTGTIDLTADFNVDLVAGTIRGSHSLGDDVTMSFLTPIDGSGYSGDLGCDIGCYSSGSSVHGGFYGPDAAETSGVVGFEYRQDIDLGPGFAPTTYIAGGGFTATGP